MIPLSPTTNNGATRRNPMELLSEPRQNELRAIAADLDVIGSMMPVMGDFLHMYMALCLRVAALEQEVERLREGT